MRSRRNQDKSHCVFGSFSNFGSHVGSPTQYGTLMKKDPERDPNSENYACDDGDEESCCPSEYE